MNTRALMISGLVGLWALGAPAAFSAGLPVCHLVNAGPSGGGDEWKIVAGGKTAYSSVSIGAVLTTYYQLRTHGFCQPDAGARVRVGGAGELNGRKHDFLLRIGARPIVGSSYGAVASLAKEVDRVGAGVLRPVGLCTIRAAGSYNGLSYSYRVAAGPEVVFGTDSLGGAADLVALLREDRFCR
jgi:hypothetical protein